MAEDVVILADVLQVLARVNEALDREGGAPDFRVEYKEALDCLFQELAGEQIVSPEEAHKLPHDTELGEGSLNAFCALKDVLAYSDERFHDLSATRSIVGECGWCLASGLEPEEDGRPAGVREVCSECGGKGAQRFLYQPFSERAVISGVMEVVLADGKEISYKEFLEMDMGGVPFVVEEM